MITPGTTSIVGLLLTASVLLPSPAVPAPATPPSAVQARADARVNINTAGVRELMGLAGVGRRLAERIVEYRGANGPFKTAEDLRKVSGIGRGLWERNRERIAVK